MQKLNLNNKTILVTEAAGAYSYRSPLRTPVHWKETWDLNHLPACGKVFVSSQSGTKNFICRKQTKTTLEKKCGFLYDRR